MSKTLQRSLEAKLAALDGPEWDSSDEEMAEPKETAKIAKKKKMQQKSKLKEGNGKEQGQVGGGDDGASRVIYLGHIPPAFEEPQILAFMSQFGKITNVKLSRSQRTGNPRGYGFIEFADEEVAAIVADTMSGYFLMGERRLVCHVMPKDKIHPELFRGAKENLARSQAGLTSSDFLKKLHDAERKKVNAPRSEEALNKITKRLLSREKKKRAQLKKLGIDYDFPGYEACIKKTPTETKSVGKKKKRKVSVDESDEETMNKKDDAQKTPKKAKTTSFETPKKSTKKSAKKPQTEIKKKSVKKPSSKNRRRSVS